MYSSMFGFAVEESFMYKALASTQAISCVRSAPPFSSSQLVMRESFRASASSACCFAVFKLPSSNCVAVLRRSMWSCGRPNDVSYGD